MKNRKVLNLIIKDLLTEVFLEIDKNYLILKEEDGSWVDDVKELGDTFSSWISGAWQLGYEYANEILVIAASDSKTIDSGQKYIKAASISSLISTGVSRIGKGVPSHLINVGSGLLYFIGGAHLIVGAAGFSSDKKSFYLISGILYMAFGIILSVGGVLATSKLFGIKGDMSDLNISAALSGISITITNGFNKTGVTIKRAFEISQEIFMDQKSNFQKAVDSGLGLKIFDNGNGHHSIRFVINTNAVIIERNGKNYLVVANDENLRLAKPYLESSPEGPMPPAPDGSPQPAPINELYLSDIETPVFATKPIEDVDVATLFEDHIEIEMNQNWKLVDDSDNSKIEIHSGVEEAIKRVIPSFEATLGLESTKALTRAAMIKIQETNEVITSIQNTVNNSSSSTVSEKEIEIIMMLVNNSGENIQIDAALLREFLESNSRAQVINALDSISRRSESIVEGAKNNQRKLQGIPSETGDGRSGTIEGNPEIDATINRRFGNETVQPSPNATNIENIQVSTMNKFRAFNTASRKAFIERMVKNLKHVQDAVRAKLKSSPVRMKIPVEDKDGNPISEIEIEFYEFLAPGLFVGKISKRAEIEALNLERSQQLAVVAAAKKKAEGFADITIDASSGKVVARDPKKPPKADSDSGKALAKYNAELFELNNIDARIKMTTDLDENSAFIVDASASRELADVMYNSLGEKWSKYPQQEQNILNDLSFSRTWFVETAGDMGENAWTRAYSAVVSNPGASWAFRVSIPSIGRVFSTDGIIGVGIDLTPFEHPTQPISNSSAVPTPVIIYYPEADDLRDVSIKYGLEQLVEKGKKVEESK